MIKIINDESKIIEEIEEARFCGIRFDIFEWDIVIDIDVLDNDLNYSRAWLIVKNYSEPSINLNTKDLFLFDAKILIPKLKLIGDKNIIKFSLTQNSNISIHCTGIILIKSNEKINLDTPNFIDRMISCSDKELLDEYIKYIEN